MKKTREPLTQCRDLCADATIRNTAIQRMDERILALVSRDLVAAEGHYHGSCYRSYVYIPQSGGTGSLTDNEDTENYDALVNQAYNKLLLFIKNELFQHPAVVKMTDLKTRLHTKPLNHCV